MKKKGFVIAVAAIVTFIVVIVVCAAIAANPKPHESENKGNLRTFICSTSIIAQED